MTTYLKSLEWRDRVKDFDESELRVLIALSHKDFPWRSIDGLRGAVKLSESELGVALKNLVEHSVVRTTASKNITQALFGLAERVDPEIEIKSAIRKFKS